MNDSANGRLNKCKKEKTKGTRYDTNERKNIVSNITGSYYEE